MSAGAVADKGIDRDRAVRLNPRIGRREGPFQRRRYDTGTGAGVAYIDIRRIEQELSGLAPRRGEIHLSAVRELVTGDLGAAAVAALRPAFGFDAAFKIGGAGRFDRIVPPLPAAVALALSDAVLVTVAFLAAVTAMVPPPEGADTSTLPLIVT